MGHRQLMGLTDEDRESTVDSCLESNACALALREHRADTAAERC